MANFVSSVDPLPSGYDVVVSQSKLRQYSFRRVKAMSSSPVPTPLFSGCPRIPSQVRKYLEAVRSLGAAAREEERRWLWRTVAISSYTRGREGQRFDQAFDALRDNASLEKYFNSTAAGHECSDLFLNSDDFRCHMSFCMTDDRRLAFAPLGVRPGDLVCIFQGARIPFGLRPLDGKGKQHRLMGPYYAGSLSEGEANHLDLPLEDFVIV